MVRFLMKQTLLINAENFLTKVYRVQVIGTMFNSSVSVSTFVFGLVEMSKASTFHSCLCT